MYLLKAVAAVLALVVARCVSKEYKKFTDRKLRLYEGFISLLSFIKTELSCRARPVSEWASEFSHPTLAECGFVDALSQEGSLISAFNRSKEKMPMLGEEASRILLSYFSSFGKSYRKEEEGEACRIYEELSRLLVRERSELLRSVRGVRILSYAVALGIIIMFL